MERPIVEKVVLLWEEDDDSDVSYLEQFKDSTDPEEQRYWEEDKKRLQEYHNGFWFMQGCRAKATVSYSIGNGNRRLETFTSGGLWGIESDCGEEYKREVEAEQIADLKQHLERFNIDTSYFTRFVKEEGRTNDGGEKKRTS